MSDRRVPSALRTAETKTSPPKQAGAVILHSAGNTGSQTSIGLALALQKAIGNQRVSNMLSSDVNRTTSAGWIQRNHHLGRGDGNRRRGVKPFDVQAEIRYWTKQGDKKSHGSSFRPIATALKNWNLAPDDQQPDFLAAVQTALQGARPHITLLQKSHWKAASQWLAERLGESEGLTGPEIIQYLKAHPDILGKHLVNETETVTLLRLLKKYVLTYLGGVRGITAENVEAKVDDLVGEGFMGGYWVGRGLCQKIAELIGTPADFQPRGDVTWNHFIVDSGKTWADPTYRQFFDKTDWAKAPPTFKGDAEAFRALNLDPDRTAAYLHFIGKA